MIGIVNAQRKIIYYIVQEILSKHTHHYYIVCQLGLSIYCTINKTKQRKRIKDIFTII